MAKRAGVRVMKAAPKSPFLQEAAARKASAEARRAVDVPVPSHDPKYGPAPSVGTLLAAARGGTVRNAAQAAQRSALLDRAQETRRRQGETSKELIDRPTYNGEESWVIDLVTRSNARLSWLPTRNSAVEDAERRLARHGAEIAAHVAEGTDYGKRAVRSYRSRLNAQGYRPEEIDRLASEWRRLVASAEYRDSNTGAASLGTFAPPQYWLEKYTIFRTNASPILNSATHVPLPETGMTVYLPQLISDIPAVEQNGENTSVVEPGPSATYASAGVGTWVALAKVSQQAIDRFGPGISYDELHAAQTARSIGGQFEAATAAVILAGAQTVSSASAAYSVPGLWDSVTAAIRLANTSTGNAINPTRLFGHVSSLTGYMSQLDDSGRPIWTPNSAAQAINNGAGEGDTGHDIVGLSTFYCQNIPTNGGSSAYQTLLVGDPQTLLVAESDVITEVIPEYDPQALTTIVRSRIYAASLIRWAAGWVALNGAQNGS